MTTPTECRKQFEYWYDQCGNGSSFHISIAAWNAGWNARASQVASSPAPPDEPLIDGYPLWSGIPQPVSQEPVAWMDEYGNVFPLAAWKYPERASHHGIYKKPWKPLYATPQPAEQAELSDADIDALWVGESLTVPQIVKRRAIVRTALAAAKRRRS